MLDRRNFEDIGTFNGVESKFAEWTFKLKLAMTSSSVECFNVMERHQQSKEDVSIEEIKDAEPDDCKRATEIYKIIGLHLSGEPLKIVRGVPDMNGVEAWRRLCRRYCPSTPARMLLRLMDVISPGRAKSVNELTTLVEKWVLKYAFTRKKS